MPEYIHITLLMLFISTLFKPVHIDFFLLKVLLILLQLLNVHCNSSVTRHMRAKQFVIV